MSLDYQRSTSISNGRLTKLSIVNDIVNLPTFCFRVNSKILNFVNFKVSKISREYNQQRVCMCGSEN